MQQSNWKGEIRREVTGLLLECLQEDSRYTAADAKECGALMEQYVDALREGVGEPEILQAVEKTVLAINGLNQKTGGAMLETGVGEAIRCILQGAALEAGFPDTGADITEAWRGW